ncbi:MAG TPA: hypothetical protein VM781_00310, partial [Candidatus Bathyarchaeia archaeon]|nr:hypothetical protein [Candidatus Bathyarchaeia archaeon]
LGGYRNSFRSISRKLVNPASASRREREHTRHASRLARSNLETSLERFAAEPGATAVQLAQANGMLASSHRFAHAMIVLEAGIPQDPSQGPPPEFEAFATAVEKTLQLLSAKLHGQRVAEREFPDLRQAYLRLVQAGDPQLDRYGFVKAEADRMANSLNTLREQISEWARGLPGKD